MDVLKDITGENNSFIEGACWPDDIKGVGYRAENNEHFINIPYFKDGYDPKNPPEIDLHNSTWATKEFKSTIDSASRSPVITNQLTNSISLRFEIHFIGDMHQPLHDAELYSPDYPTGDLGGNKFKVTTDFRSDIKNLHSFWDSGAGEYTDFDRPLSQESQDTLKSMADKLMAENTREDLKKELEIKDIYQWAQDSYQLGVDYVYQNIKQYEKITEDGDYTTGARPIVHRQIALGGYRLADVLAEAFESRWEEAEVSKFLG